VKTGSISAARGGGYGSREILASAAWHLRPRRREKLAASRKRRRGVNISGGGACISYRLRLAQHEMAKANQRRKRHQWRGGENGGSWRLARRPGAMASSASESAAYRNAASHKYRRRSAHRRQSGNGGSVSGGIAAKQL